MKSVYKATLLATATTLICGFASAGSQNGAEPDAWRARTGPFQAEMAIPPSAPAARSFDATQTPRLPVLMLTQSYGDSARELFAGGAVPYTLRNFPFKSTKTIVYLDVDTFNPRSRLNREALALAKEAGWPVVIESEAWNAGAVKEMAYRLFPEARIQALKNTSVVVESTDAGLLVRDTFPSEVAVIAGVPFDRTMEGEVAGAMRVQKKTPIHWSAIFASKAYDKKATDVDYDGKKWYLVHNADVVRVWQNTSMQCIVSWRGSSTAGDWYRDWEILVKTPKPIPGDESGGYMRIGDGLAKRLVNTPLPNLQCYETFVVGHSLGGAMAQAYALREFVRCDWSDHPREKIAGVYVYNPLRFGNEASALNLMNALRYNTPKPFRTYCRSGDPVHKVPSNLFQGTYAVRGAEEQCTHVAPQASKNLKDNHRMYHWL